MFKIKRLTDYGVVILRHLAELEKNTEAPSSARDLSLASGLPFPTVSKILKLMAKAKLIVATRGVAGGYEISDSLDKISLLQFIAIFEGPPALTACMANPPHKCQIEINCLQQGNWHLVHQKIANVLSSIYLSELIKSNKPLRLRKDFNNV